MPAITRVSRFLRKRPFFVIPLFLAVYGYGTIDVADFYRLSAAPLSLNSETSKQFLQFSPLPYFLGYPLTSTLGPRWSFAIVMLGGFSLCLLALRRLVAARYGSRQGEAALMFFATPLLIVLTQYLGKSDSYLLALVLLLPTISNPIGQILVTTLVIVSHLEIGLIVLASAMFLRILPVRTTIPGALIGAVLMFGYYNYLLPEPPQSRADMSVGFFSEAVAAVMSTPVLHLVAMFGPFWWCVLNARPLGWRWLTVFAGTTIIACATLDFSRVFTLLGLPLVIVVVDRYFAQPAAAVDSRIEPAWFAALPLFAFFNVHLLSYYAYDSRVPELIGRVFGYSTR